MQTHGSSSIYSPIYVCSYSRVPEYINTHSTSALNCQLDGQPNHFFNALKCVAKAGVHMCRWLLAAAPCAYSPQVHVALCTCTFYSILLSTYIKRSQWKTRQFGLHCEWVVPYAPISTRHRPVLACIGPLPRSVTDDEVSSAIYCSTNIVQGKVWTEIIPCMLWAEMHAIAC